MDKPINPVDKDQLVGLVCSCCDFFKESEKDLECGAFKILRRLLDRGVVTPEQVEDAQRD